MNTTQEFGVNVWWHLPETSLNGIRAQTIISKHGFKADDLTLPSRQVEVSRAAYSFQNRQGKSNRRVTEKANNTAQTITYGILDREQEGDQISFAQHTTVRLNKDNGSVTVEGSLSEAFEKALAEYQGQVTEEDLRNFLGGIIRKCCGVAKRPSGGIYFVPARFVGILKQAQTAILEFNSLARLYVEEIVNNTETRQNVWETVEADVEGRVAEAVAALGRIERRVSAVTTQKDNIQEAKELMQVYQNLLGEEAKYESLSEKLNEAEQAVARKMSELMPDGNLTVVPATATTPMQVVSKTAKAPKASKTVTGSSIIEATVKILAEAGKPMSYKEIMDAAVKQGLYDASCDEPYASFYSGLAKALNRGEKRFAKVGRGVYGLAA